MGTLLRTTLTHFNGSGGGRPDMAQGGGVDPEKLDEVLAFAGGMWGSVMVIGAGQPISIPIPELADWLIGAGQRQSPNPQSPHPPNPNQPP